MVSKVRVVLFAITLGFGWPVPVFAGVGAPDFKDYSVATDVAVSNHAYVSVSKGNPIWETAREKMAQHKPNLAGHYVAYSMDCGGGAMCAEILDVQTGKVVVGFPDAYVVSDEDEEHNFDFSTRADSRLVVVTGIGQGAEKDQNGKVVPMGFYTRYYDFDGRVLKLIYLKK